MPIRPDFFARAQENNLGIEAALQAALEVRRQNLATAKASRDRGTPFVVPETRFVGRKVEDTLQRLAGAKEAVGARAPQQDIRGQLAAQSAERQNQWAAAIARGDIQQANALDPESTIEYLNKVQTGELAQQNAGAYQNKLNQEAQMFNQQYTKALTENELNQRKLAAIDALSKGNIQAAQQLDPLLYQTYVKQEQENLNKQLPEAAQKQLADYRASIPQAQTFLDAVAQAENAVNTTETGDLFLPARFTTARSTGMPSLVGGVDRFNKLAQIDQANAALTPFSLKGLTPITEKELAFGRSQQLGIDLPKEENQRRLAFIKRKSERDMLAAQFAETYIMQHKSDQGLTAAWDAFRKDNPIVNTETGQILPDTTDWRVYINRNSQSPVNPSPTTVNKNKFKGMTKEQLLQYGIEKGYR